MAADTKIEWTDATFNPWIGCTKVGPGCDHCYAEHLMDHRMHTVRWGVGQPRKRTSASYWRQPLTWNKQAERSSRRFRVFCASLADVFDNEVPEDWRTDLFDLIATTPRLDWLLLTKRIGNAARMIAETMDELHAGQAETHSWPWPNVWLGATVVNQEEADRDIPKLLATPAAVRFLSIEPILGQVDLGLCDCDHGSVPGPYNVGGVTCPKCDGTGGHLLDWVIVGGESGAHARPTDIMHIRSIVEQCQAAGAAVFVKQLGRWPISDHVEVATDGSYCFALGPGRHTLDILFRDPKGGDPDEWPQDLRVRQFPVTAQPRA